MKKKNIAGTCIVLSVFCVLAYVVNLLIDYNYMFLMDHDGTPYQIVYNLVGGNKVAYPLMVVGLFVVYIVAFYAVYYAICKKRQKTAKEEEKIPAMTK
jgi:phosphotransferase system  glucose/maltose/N-acetylglucosamine-specific IIC component